MKLNENDCLIVVGGCTMISKNMNCPLQFCKNPFSLYWVKCEHIFITLHKISWIRKNIVMSWKRTHNSEYGFFYLVTGNVPNWCYKFCLFVLQMTIVNFKILTLRKINILKLFFHFLLSLLKYLQKTDTYHFLIMVITILFLNRSMKIYIFQNLYI